jgi:hypothetical protein
MKEVYVIPAVDEIVPEPCIALVNEVPGLANIVVGDQMLQFIAPDEYSTAGTLLWEIGMDEALAPDSSPPHRFAGWRS